MLAQYSLIKTKYHKTYLKLFKHKKKFKSGDFKKKLLKKSIFHSKTNNNLKLNDFESFTSCKI